MRNIDSLFTRIMAIIETSRPTNPIAPSLLLDQTLERMLQLQQDLSFIRGPSSEATQSKLREFCTYIQSILHSEQARVNIVEVLIDIERAIHNSMPNPPILVYYNEESDSDDFLELDPFDPNSLRRSVLSNPFPFWPNSAPITPETLSEENSGSDDDSE